LMFGMAHRVNEHLKGSGRTLRLLSLEGVMTRGARSKPRHLWR
jgi:hypothetical protein